MVMTCKVLWSFVTVLLKLCTVSTALGTRADLLGIELKMHRTEA